MGTADRECERMHDYSAAVPAPRTAGMPAGRAIEHFGQVGRRKIQT
jgi:hypothetical protein